MTAAVIFYTAAALFVAGCIVVAWLAVRDYRNPPEPRHTLDCIDWAGRGIRDPYCIAEHGTNYYATPRDAVEFMDQFDGQIGIGEKK